MAKTKKPPVNRINPIYRVIALIVTIFIAALLFVSILGIGGSIGSLLCDIFFGIMGKFFYAFPFYLVLSCYYIAIREIDKPINPVKVIMVVALFIFICLLFQVFSQAGKDYVYDPVESFEMGRDERTGGGIIGGSIGYIFLEAFGMVGALIIDIFGIILLLVIIFKDKILDYLNNKDKNKSNKISEKYMKKAENSEKAERTGKSSHRKRTYQDDEETDSSIRNFFTKKVEENPEVDRVNRMEKSVSGIDFGVNSENPIDNPPVNDEIPASDYTTVSPDEDFTPIPIDSVNDNDTAKEDTGLFTEPLSSDISDFMPEPLPVNEQEVSHIALTPIANYEDIAPEPIPEPVPEPEPETVPVSEVFTDSETVFEPEGTKEPEIIPEPEIPEAVFTPEPISEITPEPEIPENVFTPEPISEIIPEPEIPENVFSSDTNVSANPAEEEFKQTPEAPVKKEYVFPHPSLLNPYEVNTRRDTENLDETAEKLVDTLRNFGVEVSVSEYSRGPAVTRYEIIPSQGVKVSKILNLADDIKLNLAAADIRIEAPIPGKSAIGIEVPNKSVEMVHFRELIENTAFTGNSSNICFAAGKDIGGNVIISDIAKMPHVLIAGQTGSGKSVCINTIIMSILYKANPDDVKLIMIDPKVVELSVYNGIPHLLIPVVSDPKKAAGALNWAVREMNDRYQKFAALGVRDLSGYNKRIASPDFNDESGVHKKLYQLVVIVDELADLMMVSSSEVEENICRLAQLARACGIHLVVATQRPSVNVITGLIKANMPSRIAFAVTSGVDSRTILDMNGAEKLLGKGDMLYFPQGLTKPLRVQGAFVTDDEVIRVTEFIRENNIKDSNDSENEIEIESQMATAISDGSLGAANIESFKDSKDEYFAEAGRFIITNEKGSIGMLQRKFKIGFNRAARIMDQLAEAGVVGPEEGTKPRKILVDLDEFENILKEG